MRHGATLIAALEGMSRPSFRIARELALNSRAGLTVRFLSKKLELPEEEVEYLIDVNHRLFFSDLTRVKLVAEGATAVKRISQGLENHGDIPSLIRLFKSLGPAEFRRIEDRLDLNRIAGRKSVADGFIHEAYLHPDSIVEFVAKGDFSNTARELFDILWQSDDGVMPASRLRALRGGSDYAVEQGLNELLDAFAVFEMFRFDGEDRIVRMIGLLSEIREWRESAARLRASKSALKPVREKGAHAEVHALDLSQRACRLVAAVAAKPARLRADWELFREDRRRLAEICPEDANPPLATCIWLAVKVGWLVNVDNELRAANLDKLLGLDPVTRHRVLYEAMMDAPFEGNSARLLAKLLDDIQVGSWYPTVEFVNYALRATADNEQPLLKNAGGRWHYVSPATALGSDRGLARSIEETFLWLGVTDRAELDGESLFRVTPLGVYLLTGRSEEAVRAVFPPQGAEIVVQPNFDIVVPTHAVDPLLTVPLAQFATRESVGQATVYHLSKESFTHAIQEGCDGDAFVHFLLDHNRGGSLPSNVMTTLEDWRGGMKRVRLRTVHVLESDDPLVIADLMHRRRFAKHLQALDGQKTVSYHRLTKAEIRKELEKEGFVVE